MKEKSWTHEGHQQLKNSFLWRKQKHTHKKKLPTQAWKAICHDNLPPSPSIIRQQLLNMLSAEGGVCTFWRWHWPLRVVWMLVCLILSDTTVPLCMSDTWCLRERYAAIRSGERMLFLSQRMAAFHWACCVCSGPHSHRHDVKSLRRRCHNTPTALPLSHSGTLVAHIYIQGQLTNWCISFEHLVL